MGNGNHSHISLLPVANGTDLFRSSDVGQFAPVTASVARNSNSCGCRRSLNTKEACTAKPCGDDVAPRDLCRGVRPCKDVGSEKLIARVY